MLSDQEFDQWAHRCSLSAQAKSVIEHIRSSPPARRVQSRRQNVRGHFNRSRKMAHTIQYESRTVELPAIILMELDDDVLEIWDQPPSFIINYKDAAGRNRGHFYTADFFVIRQHSAGWEEWKTEEQLVNLAVKNSEKYCLGGYHRWRFPPGERHATTFGLYFHVHSSAELDLTQLQNLKLLLPYFAGPERSQGNQLAHDAILSTVAAEPGIMMAELLTRAAGAHSHDIFRLIISRQVYVDLRRAWLGDELSPLIADSPAAHSNVQCLKVVYLNAVEVNEILASYKGADVAEQFKRRLPLTTEQAQMIAAQRFETASYFEPLIDMLLTDLNDFAQSRTSYEDLVSSLKTSEPDETNAQEEIVSTVKRTILEVISLLQAATDGEGMIILTPYLLTEDQGRREDWILDLSQLQALTGSDYLNEYRKVRPAIANLFKLFNVGADLMLYEDKRYQRVKSDEAISKRAGNTDFLYLMPATGSPSRMKCLTVLLIDQWQEGIPNPEGAEMTGIALRFDSPQMEAPNAVIIATPPYLSGGEFWSADLLANTLLETIELMQIRIVGSDELRGDAHLNGLFHIPALLFPPAKDGSPLFPSRPQLFHGFDLGALYGYVLASKLTAVDLSQTTPTSARSDTPKIGGKK